ncbi:hypothetical protein A3757_18250 [Oleiphilus sp. HI0117]|nr:hypothetical protein A3757_18250 [Oleiphilus sp. HI0117]
MIRRSKFQNISFAILAAASAPALSQTLAPAQSVSPLQEEIQWLQAETYVSTATKTLEDIKKS